MKVTLESTDKIVTLNGVHARVWQGQSESGVPCHAFITRIRVASGDDNSQFERELSEHAAPRPEVIAIPMRMLL